MSRLKFKAWHPKLGEMIDFELNKFSLESIPRKPERITFENGLSVINPETLEPPKLYLRGPACTPPKGAPFAIKVIDIEDPELKIMQYLGEDCKDKNGKEYCENDIIKDNKNLYVIVRRKERFCIQSILSKEIYSFSSFGGLEAFEIVGNLHQNQEILK